MSEKKTLIQEAANVVAEKTKEMRGVLSDAVVEAFAPVFEKYPEADSFAWKQYTPSFNDGDPCEFGIMSDELDVNGCDYYDVESEFPENAEILQNASDEASKVLQEIISACCEGDHGYHFGYGLFETIWGNNRIITIHRDGTFTEGHWDCGW